MQAALRHGIDESAIDSAPGNGSGAGAPAVAEPAKSAASVPTLMLAGAVPREPEHRASTLEGTGAHRSGWDRVGMVLLLVPAGLLLAIVLLTPMALSSQDLIQWAAAPTGLGLRGHWPTLVFIALDAAAMSCVLLALFCAIRGEPAGRFGLLVWCFAALSAFANWRNASVPGAAPDAVWFFPTMSVVGPVLLDAVLRLPQGIVQRRRGTRSKRTPHFGWQRWTPGLGSFRDTYGAKRVALLLDVETVEEAVSIYHQLCPTGSIRVVRALRQHHLAQAAAQTAHPAGQPVGQPNPQLGWAYPPGSDRPVANPAHWPVDLMRRIPVQVDAYARWRAAWADLQQLTDATNHPGGDPHGPADSPHLDYPGVDGPEPDAQQLQAVADRHQISLRQMQFVRRAGQAGLLHHAQPPAVWLAELAAQHLPPATGPATTSTRTPGPATPNTAPPPDDPHGKAA